MTEKQFTIHTKEESWENEDGCFSSYRHFLMDDGVRVIELNEHINRCWDFADRLNNLHEENEQLKQEKQKIFDYIDKQIRINTNELKLWKKSNNKARKEKQVLIREANIMCLYNLLRDLKEGWND